MKKVFIIFFICLILTGCQNKKEETKDEYLTMKTSLMKEENYTKLDELPLDITIKIDRVDEEIIKYKVILNNPKENMYQIKAMVVHNYYSEDLFPSIGVFDEKKDLLTTNDKSAIELESPIKTTKNISKINLELKIWIEYKNEQGITKEVYYKTT